ncbi:MAG TPA: hypothetical protein VI542_02655 [Candidatus Tectomicrobia bacterium]
MSEYQYYEFQAIDRPLSADQQAQVATLSSRAHVTAHMASFVYNYGDFRGLAMSFSNTAMTSSRHTSYEGTRLDGSPRCL